MAPGRHRACSFRGSRLGPSEKRGPRGVHAPVGPHARQSLPATPAKEPKTSVASEGVVQSFPLLELWGIGVKCNAAIRSTILFAIFYGSFTSAIAQSNAKGFLGLALADVPGAAGAMVEGVKPGGPAEQAGVQAGDIIVAIDGRPVDRGATLTRIIGAMTADQTTHLGVIRRIGSSVRRLEIEVVVGSPSGSFPGGLPGTASNSAPRAAVAPRSPSTPPPVPIPSSEAAKNTTAAPLPGSGYVRLMDPLEQAFTVDVPSGWRSVAGLARQAALQINPFVRSLSFDKMTYVMIGEPTLPSFSPPTPMGNVIGHREGMLYDAGLGGRALVMRYLPGAEFARAYGETFLAGLCPSLRFTAARDRPELARQAAALLPTIIPSREDGGEASFTCTHNKQEMEARVEAVTRITRDNLMWVAILLEGYIAPKGQSNVAEATLLHVAGSMHFSQAWIEKQNALSQQAAVAINQRMQETFRQERVFIRNLNSVDENFESMDEIVSGFSTYHDEKTGNDYSLSNTSPNKWIDDNTGRIISTPTNSKPPWASAYRLLPRASN